MNILHLDFNKHLKNVIDATIEVYGEECKDIIEERAKKIVYFPYTTGPDVSFYFGSLLNVKKKELSLKFLNKTGLFKNEEDNKKIILNYLGFNEFNVGGYTDNCGIKSFLDDLEIDESVIENQIEFLNYLRNNKESLITFENYELYKTTDEYFKLYQKIQKYLIVYKELKQEMNEFYNSFDEYKEFIKFEKDLEKEIYDKKLVDLYQKVEQILPKKVKEILELNNITDLQKANMLFDNKISFEMNIESFSKENEDKLQDPEESEITKRLIINSRLKYLSVFGFENTTIEQEKNYKLIQNEEIRQLIPSPIVAEIISQTREYFYEQARKEIIFLNKFFAENTKEMDFYYKECFYQYVKAHQTCITAIKRNNIIPVMILCIGFQSLGKLDYIYLHEFVHAIETVFYSVESCCCGYDDITLFQPINPYDETKRKYERMNETFTDIIALEIQKKLQDKQIYMFESKEYLYEALDECNTSKILKNILYPIYEKYKSLILKTRITHDIHSLCDKIGSDNFEELNDIINKVDYLINQGLFYKIRENKNYDPLVIEYNKQLERVSKVYNNIEMTSSIFSEEQRYNKYYY